MIIVIDIYYFWWLSEKHISEISLFNACSSEQCFEIIVHPMICISTPEI